jgi:hypothetical protein
MVNKVPVSNSERNETVTSRNANWRNAGIVSAITGSPKAAMRREADGDPGDPKCVDGPCAGAKFWGSRPAVPTHGLSPVVLAVPDRRQAGHTPFPHWPLVSSSQEALDDSVLKGKARGRDDRYVSTGDVSAGDETTRQWSQS